MSAALTVLAGWTLWKLAARAVPRWWRSACCARGHHRETVDTPVTACRRCIGENMYAILPSYPTVYRCVDCGWINPEPLSEDTVFTPSRRRTAA